MDLSAKTIKNLVKINAQLSAEQLMKLVEQLKSELSSSKKYSAFLEKQISWMKSSAYSPGAPLPPVSFPVLVLLLVFAVIS